MKLVLPAIALASLLLFSLLAPATPEEKVLEVEEKPLLVSADVEAHAFGMSFCADGNTLLYDPATGMYSESKHTSQLFPECVYVEVQAKNFSEVPQVEGESEFENVTIVNLTCLQERCSQIVNLDPDSGHVVSEWQKE